MATDKSDMLSIAAENADGYTAVFTFQNKPIPSAKIKCMSRLYGSRITHILSNMKYTISGHRRVC